MRRIEYHRTFHPCPIYNTTEHAYLQLEVLLACRALNLGRSWWPITSQVATLANFYLTTWEEFHTGTLYLGYFSGPVEGIIMIVVLYIFTGIFGELYLVAHEGARTDAIHGS